PECHLFESDRRYQAKNADIESRRSFFVRKVRSIDCFCMLSEMKQSPRHGAAAVSCPLRSGASQTQSMGKIAE
ncbi:MAG: hypothetical protein MR740_01235, partial [Clostridium sp.]|nr:hypothetical protein [Clostridium sp.]